MEEQIVVYEITEQQANLLMFKLCNNDYMLFNPVQDLNNRYVISEQEYNGCTNPEFINIINSSKKINWLPPKVEDE